MRGPESVVAEVRPTLEANRDELLDALQDEAEEEVARWPRAFRQWLVQTIAFALSEGLERREAWWRAFESVGVEYADRRHEVAALHVADQMHAAAIDAFALAE